MATVYDIITLQIVNALEAGTVPWKKPWSTACPTLNGEPVMDQNLFTKKPYRGVNWLLTALAPFSSPFWVPRGEIRKRKLKIKEGEHYTPIVYFKWRDAKEIEQAKREGKAVSPCFARFFQAWNVEQLEGVEKFIPELDTPEEHDHTPIRKAVNVVENYTNKPEIKHNEPRAYYNALGDFINMPELNVFDTPEDYHGTLFHELVHATGHQKRLARDTLTEYAPFGSVTYSKEELVAEIGSCFLCTTIGIDTPKTFESTASYIAGWLSKIKKDSRMVISAAQQAQKAVDEILQTKLKKIDKK